MKAARAKFSCLGKSSVEVAKCEIASHSLVKFASKATLRFHVAFVNLPIFRHIKRATQKSTNGSSATTICIFMSNSRGSGWHLILLFFHQHVGYHLCVHQEQAAGEMNIESCLPHTARALFDPSYVSKVGASDEPGSNTTRHWSQQQSLAKSREKKTAEAGFFSYLSGARRRATRFSPGFN